MKHKGEAPRHVKQPLTHEHLDAHLDGTGPAIGLAPIVPGSSTTSVAVLDFDDHSAVLPWERVSAVVESVAQELRTRGYAPHLFRSRGGRGVHLYVFWQQPIEARDARELMRDVLERCGLKPGTKGIEHCEVECFPKQDSVPADGAGSMWILPYCGESEMLEIEEELF